jgi:hypothetical protein
MRDLDLTRREHAAPYINLDVEQMPGENGEAFARIESGACDSEQEVRDWQDEHLAAPGAIRRIVDGKVARWFLAEMDSSEAAMIEDGVE